MITITRRQARRLRAVFRRHPLGIAHRRVVPPLVFCSDPTAGLRVRHHQAHLAVEHVLPGSCGEQEVLAVPLDALADFEGNLDAPVVLEAAAPDRTVARWEDRGIPQSREYDVPDPATLPAFPGPPAYLTLCPADLLDALAEAAATTDADSSRYALDCIQLKATGEVVATDGRQLLVHSGFHFPWEDDLLVRGTTLFASRALPRERSVQVGRSDTHVAVRAGDWTMWLAVQTDARFPRTESVVPTSWAATTRLRLDPEDAAFLGRALDRLPGADVFNSPATLDLNGRVVVRAQGEDQATATELVLSRSAYTGAPVRVSANRAFLARAVRLGLGDFEITGAGSPVVLRDQRRVFCFQPLSEDSAIEPSDDVTRVEPTSAVTPPLTRPVASIQGESPMPDKNIADPPSRVERKAEVQATPPEEAGAGGLVELIRQAEALHEALTDAKGRAGRLTVALRRHRRRERLVSNTLASLKALKLQDVSG